MFIIDNSIIDSYIYRLFVEIYAHVLPSNSLLLLIYYLDIVNYHYTLLQIWHEIVSMQQLTIMDNMISSMCHFLPMFKH
jgi:hypothetical protein